MLHWPVYKLSFEMEERTTSFTSHFTPSTQTNTHTHTLQLNTLPTSAPINTLLSKFHMEVCVCVYFFPLQEPLLPPLEFFSPHLPELTSKQVSLLPEARSFLVFLKSHLGNSNFLDTLLPCRDELGDVCS